MGRFSKSDDATFEDLILLLKKNEKNLKQFVDLLLPRASETYFQPLRTAVEKMGAAASVRPPYSEIYMQQWTDFDAGKVKNLERSAARYLCWESDIATTEKFLAYLQQSTMELDRRSLEGLVRSCHNKWEGQFPLSPVVKIAKQFLHKYDGPNPVLLKWKSNLNAIIDARAPQTLAKEFSETDRTLEDHLSRWFLDKTTPFVRDLVMALTTIACENLDKSNDQLLVRLKELLSWPSWRISDLKKEIGEIILHKACIGKTQDFIQTFVLASKRLLGDPRLPANRSKWAEVPEAAKKKLLEWLCREDIYFFFDHVYQGTSDRQHRKEFWLKYIGRCVASRPLLGSNDAVRLLTDFQRDQSKAGHFGKLRGGGDNSAFLLDFGSITVVEFSKIGACFLYENHVFANMVDFWQGKPFSENDLRDRSHCLNRIRHVKTTNVDWRVDTQRALAMKNIRPG